jgi:2-methylcitrate dehydratase PrpD
MSTNDAVAFGLAGFTHGLSLAKVPVEVSLRARHLMLDAIGCALAARHETFAARFLSAISALAGDSAGGSGVIGYSKRLPLRDAAMLNGILMHGLDYDDTHMAGVVHLTVSVLPTVLSLSAQRGASGADMLVAYIAAIEAGARIASASTGGFHAQGFHPTGVVGAFASTLGAARILGLTPTQMVHAQGTVLSLASGSLQFIEDGAWTKRIHPGWAAQAGITAATFAAHDIVGSEAPYTGRYGLYRSYLGEAGQARLNLDVTTAGLSAANGATVWELEKIAVKPFAMCHFVHAATDAAIALHRQGLEVSAISDIEILVPAEAVPLVCEPAERKRRPRNEYDAKFSLPYAVVSGLLRGCMGLIELEPSAYLNDAVQALMDKVRYSVDPDAGFPRYYSGEVRVTLADGSLLRHREAINRGNAERPLTNSEVSEKFMENALLSCSEAHALAIREQVLALDALSDVRTLETLLANDPPAS